MMIKPKKSLGQNFLQDKGIVERIVREADINSNDVVLEIGPGKGALTEELIKTAKKVVATEIDQRLIDDLKNKFKASGNVEIINQDILNLNLPKLIFESGLHETGYKVVANIPYYITSKIIRLLLETEYPPSELVLMVQKEVAERIVAKPGEMSILAASVQYYAEAEILFDVPCSAFDPVPEVDSAVIKIIRNKKQKTSDKEEIKNFFRVVKAGFCAKRKTLANNLANSLHLNKKEIEMMLDSLDFSPSVRAQELSIDDWNKIRDKFNTAKFKHGLENGLLKLVKGPKE